VYLFLKKLTLYRDSAQDVQILGSEIKEYLAKSNSKFCNYGVKKGLVEKKKSIVLNELPELESAIEYCINNSLLIARNIKRKAFLQTLLLLQGSNIPFDLLKNIEINAQSIDAFVQKEDELRTKISFKTRMGLLKRKLKGLPFGNPNILDIRNTDTR